MAELNQTRQAGLLTRLFGLKGAAILESVHSEIFPVLDLDNVRPENLFYLSENIHTASAATGSVAGPIGLQLFNPAGSGKLVVVEEIIWTINAIQNLQLSLTTLPYAAAVTAQARGRDLRNRAAPSCQFRKGPPTAADLGALMGAGFVFAANERAVWNQPIVLLPGFGVNLDNTTTVATLSMSAAFSYRERAFEQSEA